jgi:GT2 family glycosyltransferase
MMSLKFNASVDGNGESTAVIIVGHNEADWIHGCLESVLKEVLPSSVFYVDNASIDDTVRIVRNSFPDITILQSTTNSGFAAANNMVLRNLLSASSFEYFFLLNPDTLLPKGVIDKLQEFLRDHPSYAVVGPLQVEYDGLNATSELNRVSQRDVAIGQYHILRRWIPEVTLHVRADNMPEVLNVYYVQGSAFFVRAAVLQDVGFFDEIFHSFYEEVDLCRRALWAGYKLGLLTSLRLPHASRGVGDGSHFRRYLRFRNKYLFTLTDPNVALRWLPATLLRLLVWDLRQAVSSPRNAEIRLASSLVAVAWLVRNAAQVTRSRACREKMAKSGGSNSLVGRMVNGRVNVF